MRLWKLMALVCVSAVVSAEVLFDNTAQAGEVYLGDIVGNGDGTGNATGEYVGINADTGFFEVGHNNADIPNSGENPQFV